MGSKPSVRSSNILGRMVLSFFEPKKAIFYENIEGAEKAPHHLTYIFEPATNRVNFHLKGEKPLRGMPPP